MTPINFKANFIKPAIVQKKTNNDYNPCEVSFIELDTKNDNDIKSMKKLSKDWGYNTFAYQIYYDMSANDGNIDKSIHYYGLTEQKSNFENIEPDKILGIMEF